jgi:hypothetical protein
VVQWARRGLIADGRANGFAADHTLQAHLTHQSLHSAAGNRDALALHLSPDFAHAVDSEVLREHAGDLGLQLHVTTGSGRKLLGIAPLRHTLVIGGWGDRQDFADRLDPIAIVVIVDEGDHRLNGRSSSAWAK